jgi:hypothetical protein
MPPEDTSNSIWSQSFNTSSLGISDPVVLISIVGSVFAFAYPNFATTFLTFGWWVVILALIAIAICDYTGILNRSYRLQRLVWLVIFLILLGVALYWNTSCINSGGHWTFQTGIKASWQTCTTTE